MNGRNTDNTDIIVAVPVSAVAIIGLANPPVVADDVNLDAPIVLLQLPLFLHQQ